MSVEDQPLHDYLSLCEALTGFERAALLGTGQAQTNLDKLVEVVGEEIAAELWRLAAQLRALSGSELDDAVRRELLASAKYGPIARNLIRLWYLGMWFELPETWQRLWTSTAADVTGFTNAAGYRESLVWRVMEAHPPGAKQPGYGSWGLLPLSAVSAAAEGTTTVEDVS